MTTQWWRRRREIARSRCLDRLQDLLDGQPTRKKRGPYRKQGVPWQLKYQRYRLYRKIAKRAKKLRKAEEAAEYRRNKPERTKMLRVMRQRILKRLDKRIRDLRGDAWNERERHEVEIAYAMWQAEKRHARWRNFVFRAMNNHGVRTPNILCGIATTLGGLNRGRYISKQALIDAVYGDNPDGGPLHADNCITLGIMRLRDLGVPIFTHNHGNLYMIPRPEDVEAARNNPVNYDGRARDYSMINHRRGYHGTLGHNHRKRER